MSILSTVLLTGCTAAPAAITPSATVEATAAPSTPPSGTTVVVSDGCGGTSLSQGNPPTWATGQEHGFTGPNELVYATSDHGSVVAYLYGYPLAVQDLGSQLNKILWFVQDPTGPLTLTGYLEDSPSTTITETVTGAGADGFPSEVDVPAAGCWHFTVTWNDSNTVQIDTISLQYLEHR